MKTKEQRVSRVYMYFATVCVLVVVCGFLATSSLGGFLMVMLALAFWPILLVALIIGWAIAERLDAKDGNVVKNKAVDNRNKAILLLCLLVAWAFLYFIF